MCENGLEWFWEGGGVTDCVLGDYFRLSNLPVQKPVAAKR